MSNKNAFLYQINFNRSKYPEICNALEKAKSGNGVAWYLRKLIEKDIRESRIYEEGISIFEEEPKYDEPIKYKKNSNSSKVRNENKQENEEDLLPDDSGGFL